MAKKFIRHLEFYGFPDQNVYTSDINGCCNVDLSEIINKNKEQDEEIQDLTDEKANEKDLLELSGTVESMIEVQSEINQELAETVSGHTQMLEDITNTVNDISDAINDVTCSMQGLGDKVDEVAGDLAELSGKVETFSAETQEAISELHEELDEKLDKTEAEETYVKIGDVYTKEEVDAKIAEAVEPFPTKEWVEENFLTQEQGDERYAKKETVDALSDRVNSAVTDLNTKIYTLSGSVGDFSATTNNRFNVLETNFETLRGEVNRKIDNLSGIVDTFDERITQNAEDIDALEEEMARKANQVDLEALQTRVHNLSDIVDTKVSKAEFETYKSFVSNQLNDLDDRKADKRDLEDINDRIDDLDDKVDQEIENRTSGDTYILNVISGINETIIEIKEDGEGYDDRITDLENGLAQEITDRQQGDLDLIGAETDPYDYDTIWGAKNFSKNQRRLAVNEANAYTDQAVSGLRSDMNAQFEQVEQEISGKADKDYVDRTKNELKAELENEISSAVEAEKDRALEVEGNLLARIVQNTSAITENDSAIDDLADKVNAITEWDGHESGDYISWADAHPDAAGVLDVLHREFHQLIDTLTQKGILP